MPLEERRFGGKIKKSIFFQISQKNKTFFQKGVDKTKQMRYNIKVRKKRICAFSSAG